jgi:hypothetical protein
VKGDFVATTRVKEQYRMMILELVAPTKVKNKPDDLDVVTASYLQGEFYDASLYKEVYWEHAMWGNLIIRPIIISTGAPISISGVKDDFFEGITSIDATL